MNPGARRAALSLESSQLTAHPLRNYMLFYQPLCSPRREGGSEREERKGARRKRRAGVKGRQNLIKVWRGRGGEM